MAIIRQRDHDTPVKEWVLEVTTASEIDMKSRLVTFLLWAFGGSLATTLAIFLLQGFSHGIWFSLDPGTLHWLGGATVGEIAGLLGITIKGLFGRKK